MGLPKDEGGGKPISEFAALRSKGYCVLFADQQQMNKCKGVKKCVTKVLTFKTYKQCLDTGKPASDAEMSVISSKLHQLIILTFTKKTLSAFDDKRWYKDAVNSYAHWHYKIK